MQKRDALLQVGVLEAASDQKRRRPLAARRTFVVMSNYLNKTRDGLRRESG